MGGHLVPARRPRESGAGLERAVSAAEVEDGLDGVGQSSRARGGGR